MAALYMWIQPFVSKDLRKGQRYIHVSRKHVSAKREKVSKAIEINKRILQNDNVSDIIHILKENGKEQNVNIVNYVTGLHKLIQIISKNEKVYEHNCKWLNSEIENTIHKILKRLSYKKQFEKANHYNVRLFSSFLWSYSKYCSFRQEPEQMFNIRNNSNITKKTQKGDSIESATFVSKSWTENKHYFPICHGNSFYTYNESVLYMLYFYANIYLNYANPSRYIIILWALSKLSKLNKIQSQKRLNKVHKSESVEQVENDLFQKYEQKSIDMLPLLQSKEIPIILYAYSFVNYPNFDFYEKIKNFILKREVHKKLIDAHSYESLSNLLWAYSNKDIFFPDLLQSIGNYMYENISCFSCLKNKELLTILFCFCKFPVLFFEKEKTEKGYNKNVVFYELLKKRTLHRLYLYSSNELKYKIGYQISDNNFPFKKTNEQKKETITEQRKVVFLFPQYYSLYTKNANGVSLVNMILTAWSLSLKYIYSAKLFLQICVELKEMMNKQNTYSICRSNYHILTNFYFSFLSFVLSDEIFINLYLNKEERECLQVLHDTVSHFTEMLLLIKKTVHMNQRKHDVYTSFMQKSIFHLIKKKERENEITVLLEYVCPLNISIDILLVKQNHCLGICKEMENKERYSQRIDSRNTGNTMNTGNTVYKNEKYIGSENRNNKCYSLLNTQSFTWNNLPFSQFHRRICHSKLNEVSQFHRRICHSKLNEVINYGFFIQSKFQSKLFCMKFQSQKKQWNDSKRVELYMFVDALQSCEHSHDSRKRDIKKEIKKTCNNLYAFLKENSAYIKDGDIISFYYKFSLFCRSFYEIYNELHWRELCRVFFFFHNFAFNFLKKKKTKKELNSSFFDILWIYFRYFKYVTCLHKFDVCVHSKKDTKTCCGVDITQERETILSFFNSAKKQIMEVDEEEEHFLMRHNTSKNITLFLSVYLSLENSNDIITHFEKNHLNCIQFSMRDILFILQGISKSKRYMHLGKPFCKKFVEHIENCDKKDLVDFTFYCAELKVNEEYVNSSIIKKLFSDIYINKFKEFSKEREIGNTVLKNRKKIDVEFNSLHEKEEQQKKRMSMQRKFIESLLGEELASLIRNCYRMHCFGENVFNTFCQLSWEKRKEMNIKHLCIILPSLARFYCIQTREVDSDMEEGEHVRKVHKRKPALSFHTLEEHTNKLKRNVPVTLQQLIKYTEQELSKYVISVEKDDEVNKSKNCRPYFFHLCYLMESITLLQIENKKLYKECIKRTLEEIGNFESKKKEKESLEKMIGKILWCLSYYHKTEFFFSYKIIQFLLKNRLYETSVVPENFTSFFLYFVKSRVLNECLFQTMGKAVMQNISLNNSSQTKECVSFKINVISELYGTMSWAYALSFHDGTEKKDKSKNGIDTENLHFLQYNEFLKKVYTFLLNEILFLEKKKCLSFSLLCRYLWSVSIVNLIDKNLLYVINKYNWDSISFYNKRTMHLHMIYTFMLRLKYDHATEIMSDSFNRFGKSIMELFKNETSRHKDIFKNRNHKRSFSKNANISTFHNQIITLLEELNIPYESEFLVEDYLSVDIKIDSSPEEKIAIEVDGPSHHFLLLNACIEKTAENMQKKYVKCGATRFKNYLLEKNNWKVINIPSFEWNKFSREEKKKYVIGKLTQVSANLKAYLNL